MRKTLTQFAFFVTTLTLASGLHAQSRPSAETAVAMVKEAVQYLNKNGKESTFSEIDNPKGRFINGELYLVATGLDGTVLAHGSNAKLIGKNIYEVKDMDGKLFVQEQIKLAKSAGNGWVDFRWPNPVTKVIEPKTVYIQRVGDLLIAGGIYKK